jgi:hypothetical protein
MALPSTKTVSTYKQEVHPIGCKSDFISLGEYWMLDSQGINPLDEPAGFRIKSPKALWFIHRVIHYLAAIKF